MKLSDLQLAATLIFLVALLVFAVNVAQAPPAVEWIVAGICGIALLPAAWSFLRLRAARRGESR